MSYLVGIKIVWDSLKWIKHFLSQQVPCQSALHDFSEESGWSYLGTRGQSDGSLLGSEDESKDGSLLGSDDGSLLGSEDGSLLGFEDGSEDGMNMISISI